MERGVNKITKHFEMNVWCTYCPISLSKWLGTLSLKSLEIWNVNVFFLFVLFGASALIFLYISCLFWFFFKCRKISILKIYRFILWKLFKTKNDSTNDRLSLGSSLKMHLIYMNIYLKLTCKEKENIFFKLRYII